MRRGCGGPMSLHGGARLAAQHPAMARLPAPRPAGRAHRTADLRRQRCQGPRPGRGLERGGGRVDNYLAMVVVDRRRRRHRARRPPARRGRGQRRPHRPRHRRPGGRHCACGARGCLEAEASRAVHRGDHGTPVGRSPTRDASSGPAAWRAGPWRRWPTCSISGSPSSPARSPSASGTVLRPPRRPSSIGAPPRVLDGAPHRARAGCGAHGPLLGAAAVGFKRLWAVTSVRREVRVRSRPGRAAMPSGTVARCCAIRMSGVAVRQASVWRTGRVVAPASVPSRSRSRLPAVPHGDRLRRRAATRRRPRRTWSPTCAGVARGGRRRGERPRGHRRPASIRVVRVSVPVRRPHRSAHRTDDVRDRSSCGGDRSMGSTVGASVRHSPVGATWSNPRRGVVGADRAALPGARVRLDVVREC